MATDFTRIADYSGNDFVARSLQVGALLAQNSTGFHAPWNAMSGAAPTSVTTTSTTATAAIILGGILVDANAAAVTVTLDTAANIVAAVNTATAGANIGDLFQLVIINGGSTSGAITVAAGSGGAFDANVPAANRTIAINTQKSVWIRLTNVTSGSEAYVIYM